MSWYAVTIQGCDDSTRYLTAISRTEAESWVNESARFSRYGCQPTIRCTPVVDLAYGSDYDECLLDYVEAMLTVYVAENPVGP